MCCRKCFLSCMLRISLTFAPIFFILVSTIQVKNRNKSIKNLTTSTGSILNRENSFIKLTVKKDEEESKAYKLSGVKNKNPSIDVKYLLAKHVAEEELRYQENGKKRKRNDNKGHNNLSKTNEIKIHGEKKRKDAENEQENELGTLNDEASQNNLTKSAEIKNHGTLTNKNAMKGNKMSTQNLTNKTEKIETGTNSKSKDKSFSNFGENESVKKTAKNTKAGENSKVVVNTNKVKNLKSQKNPEENAKEEMNSTNTPIESKLATIQWPKFTEKDTKNLINIQKNAENVRKMLKIRKAVSMHLEDQKLIKQDCDLSTFGPHFCALDSKAEKVLWKLENRQNTVILIIGVLMLIIAMVAQTWLKCIENRVAKTKDIFSKQVMEIAFRQIATISLVNVFLWAILQTNVAEILDEIIFGDIMPRERDVDRVLSNVQPILESLFEELFFVSFLFLLWYVLFVLYFQLVVNGIVQWMKRVDELDPITVAEKALAERNLICGRLLWCASVSKVNFLAHRFEFADMVETISIPGVDPQGYYFVEYLRASLMNMTVEMLRLPNSSLFFLIIVGIVLRPTFSFRLNQEVILFITLSAMSLFLVFAIWFNASRIEKKLLPRFVSHYLKKKCEIEDSASPVNEETKLSLKVFCPVYKLQKQQSVSSSCGKFLRGTSLPNKHEQLFFFWARGPSIILRLFDIAYTSQLVLLSWWIYLIRSHPLTWLKIYCWASLFIIVCAILQFSIMTHVLWTLLITIKGGMLIDVNLLEKVVEIQRGESVRRLAELIDTIRIKSTLLVLKEEGDIAWKSLKSQVEKLQPEISAYLETLWVSLDEKETGDINISKIYRYLTSQGLTIKSENDVHEFLQFFDRDKKGGLNQLQFYVLAIVVKKMLVEPLNLQAVEELFKKKFNIEWSGEPSIDLNVLSQILNKLGISWTLGKKRYMLELINGKSKGRAVSPIEFVTQLRRLEAITLQPLQEAAGDIQKGVFNAV